jgi:hypothetical protein
MEQKKMAYKSFGEGLKDGDFLYEIGKTYEIEGEIEVHKRGFHACYNPLDVRRFYKFHEARFAKVELQGEIKEDGGIVCTSKIKIVKELTLEDLMEEAKKYISTHSLPDYYLVDDDFTTIGDEDNIVIFNTGSGNQISVSGRNILIVSMGKSVIDADIDDSYIVSLGNEERITLVKQGEQVSAGGSTEILSEGDSADIVINTTDCHTVSRGDNASIKIIGMFNELVSTGNFARISEKGSCTSITSTGVHAVIVSSGDMATVSAKTGSMVTLSEYAFDENGEYSIKGVKTAYIDGERIKGDTPYQLVDGEFKKQ